MNIDIGSSACDGTDPTGRADTLEDPVNRIDSFHGSAPCWIDQLGTHSRSYHMTLILLLYLGTQIFEVPARLGVEELGVHD
jgi:hypothetical protein